MPLAKLKSAVPFAPRRRPHLRVVATDMAPAPSPARALQQRLETSTRAIARVQVDRWSVRRGATMIVTSACAATMAMLMVGMQAARVVM